LIEPIEGIDIKDVKFDVFQDQSGKDKKLASNVTDGTVTAFLSSSTLYIANVAGIGKDVFSGLQLLQHMIISKKSLERFFIRMHLGYTGMLT